MESLNNFEIELLNSIVEENKEKYPFILKQVPYIKIRDREFTGVGSYSNFEFTKHLDTSDVNEQLFSRRRLTIPELKNELSYVLDITNGIINHLEIVTNGNEDWDGRTDNFTLSES